MCVWSECGEVSGYIMCTFIVSEDAYRIDAEIDGEVVGLDILDTAGQVGEHIFFSFLFLILFILIYFTVFSLLLLHLLRNLEVWLYNYVTCVTYNNYNSICNQTLWYLCDKNIQFQIWIFNRTLVTTAGHTTDFGLNCELMR